MQIDVDSFGYLSGGDDGLLADVVGHDWLLPYSPSGVMQNFAWDAGSTGMMAQVMTHNKLRDFACTADVLDILSRYASDDFNVIAHGRCGNNELSIVQITALLDVVSEEESIWGRHSWSGIEFPQIDSSLNKTLSMRVFRVPSPGLMLSCFVGERIKIEFEERMIQGVDFIRAEVGN